MKAVLLAVGLSLAPLVSAEPISLVGDTVDASMIRTKDEGYGLGRIYGYGLDSPFLVQDGDADTKQYSGTFTLNVDGGKFSMNYLTSAGWQDGIVFRLDDLDFTSPAHAPLSHLSVSTNLTGYSLLVGADFIEIGLGGVHFDSNSYFVGAFESTSVPEPGTLALLSVASLCGVGFRRICRPV